MHLREQEHHIAEVLQVLSRSSIEMIGALDLDKVTPQGLRDAASELYWNGQITREAASMLFGLACDRPEGVEFDAVEAMHAASETEKRLLPDTYQYENLRLYRECETLASGLRIATDFLRKLHTVSARA